MSDKTQTKIRVEWGSPTPVCEGGEEHARQGSTTIMEPYGLMIDPQGNNHGPIRDYIILFKGEQYIEVTMASHLIEGILQSLNKAYKRGWEDASDTLMNREELLTPGMRQT